MAYQPPAAGQSTPAAATATVPGRPASQPNATFEGEGASSQSSTLLERRNKTVAPLDLKKDEGASGA